MLHSYVVLLNGYLPAQVALPADLPYRALSKEVGDTDPEVGLILDQRHALVVIEPEALEALWHPSSGPRAGWLLFRSSAGASSATVEPEAVLPQLWFEGGGQRTIAVLAESAGWAQSRAAAVALFELPPGDVADRPELARCGLTVDGREISIELPPGWVDRLRAAPATRG